MSASNRRPALPEALPPTTTPLLTGFAPAMQADATLLIMGSFPGEASLAAQQYYAHPRNQFWRLLSAVLNDELVTLAYEARLARLAQHRIGLWDVIDACQREGSLDSSIRQARAADFSLLQHGFPALRTIAFNGKTSGRFAPQFEAEGYRTLVLPSSSPAYAQLSFEQKLVKWRALLS